MHAISFTQAASYKIPSFNLSDYESIEHYGIATRGRHGLASKRNR